VLLRSRIGATQLPLRYGGSRPDVTVRQPVQESSPLPSSSSSSLSSSSSSLSAAAASDDHEVTSVRSVSEVMDPIAVAAALKEEIKELKELEAKVKQDPLDHEVLEMLDPDKQAMNLTMPEEAIEGNFITQPSSEGRSDIAPKGNLVVELEVDKLHGSSVAVSWTFKLHTYLATMDIGFSVIFQPKDKSAKVSSSK
jgi:hypothetical protein